MTFLVKQRWAFWLTSLLVANHALADQCTNVFSDAAGSYQNGGSLKIERNASIRNTDGILDFAAGAIDDNSNGLSCTTQTCQASGLTTAELDLPAFKHSSSSQDFTLARNLTGIIEADEYDNVELKENSEAHFTTPNSEYLIDKLKVERNALVYLAAGEYWIDSVEIKENSQIIHSGIGTGPVIIYSDDIKFERNTAINIASDPDQLILISYDDIEIKENTQVKAITYALDKIKLERNTALTGAATAKDIELKENAYISYSQTSVAGLDLGDVCGDNNSGNSPVLVAHFAFEESSWPGDNSVLDSSGNNAHGSPVGGVSSVLSNDQISCRAAAFPSNTSVGDIDAINTGIDLNDQVGTAGTLAFWFRSTEDWSNGSQDRSLFDASSDDQNNAVDPYFFAYLNTFGQIEFGIEDGRDADRRVQTGVLNYTANEWVHLAFVYDSANNIMDIWVNGNQVSTTFTASANLDGTLGNVDTLYFGDNRSTYVIGTDDSAYGEIDEAYIYRSTLDGTEINNLVGAVTTCEPPTPTPIAHWSFDICVLNGAVGDVVDSINGYNGTSAGGASIDESGRFCQAAMFFGNDEYLTITNQPAFEIDEGAISFWFKRNSGDNGDMGIISKDASGFGNSGHLTVWTTHNRRILVRLQDTDQYFGYDYYLESGALNDDQWHHVVYTWGATGLALYVNNQIVDQNNSVINVGLAGNDEPMVIGADATLTDAQSAPPQQLRQFFDGSVDDIQFYADQLNGTHIDEVYNQSVYACTNCAVEPVLESLWTFDMCLLEGQAGEIIDTGNLSNNGTAIGGPIAQAQAKFCQGIQFLGNDEHVNIPHNPNYAASRGAVSFWYRRTTGTSGDMGLWSKDSTDHDSGGHLTIWSKSDKSIQVSHEYLENNNPRIESLDSGTLTDGQWHHVMYTWGINGLFLYVDNQLVDSVNVQADMVNNLEPIILGANADNSGDLTSDPGALNAFFIGDIDDVRLYSTGQPDAGDVATLFNQSPYSCAETCDTTPVLESYWTSDLCSLGSGTGEFVDIGDSNLANHGTGKGGAAAEIDGKYCQAVEFAGDDEHINIPHHSNYATAQGGVSFWFRRDPFITGDMGLFSKDSADHDNGGHLTILSKSNKAIQVSHQFIENGSDQNVSLDSIELNDGEWHHVFYTWGATGMTLYVNNQLVDQENVEFAGVESNAEPIILGASAVDSGDLVSTTGTLHSFFAGDMDDVRFYSTYQPDPQLVAAVFNLAPYACSSCDDSPLAWYQFEESSWNAGNTVIDSMNNFDGSPVGNITPVLPIDLVACQVMDIPDNNSRSNFDALDTGINPRDDIGPKGTISFWYKSNIDWRAQNNSDRRMLLDASQSNAQTFYLKLNRNGVLRFSVTDEDGDLFTARSTRQNFSAGEWVFIAVSWDLEAGSIRLYAKTDSVDNTVFSNFSSASERFSNLLSLYVGDNRITSRVQGVVPGSADGQIDNLRIYNFTQTETEINADKYQNSDCNTQIHHYQLSFDPSASVCSSTRLTVKACGDESCSAGNLVDVGSTADIRYTDDNGSTNTIASSLAMPGGTGVFDWDNNTAQTYTLSLDNTSPSGEQVATCSPADCEISFDDVELQILVSGSDTAIPRQIAQTAFGGTFAVQAAQSCNNLPSNTPLELAIECVDPAICASGASDIFTVGGVTIAENSAGNVTNFTTVNNNFDPLNPVTLGSMVYHDAGLIRLHARVGTAKVSKEFVVAPAKLGFTANATSPQVAGDEFTLNIQALGSQDAILPGYEPGDLQMRVQRIAPNHVGSVDGNVVFSDSGNNGSNSVTSNNTFAVIDESLMAFVNGQSTGYKAYYTEAGQIDITVKEHDYFGQPVSNNGTSAQIGSVVFIPDYFSVADSSPDLVDTCTNFSYWGQPIPLQETTLTLTAFNARDEELFNFTDWDLNLDGSLITEPSASGWKVDQQSISNSGTSVNNQWQVSFNANLAFSRSDTPVIPTSSPPAEVVVESGFFVHNSYPDLCLQNAPLGACVNHNIADITGANLRWGRLVLDNTFGGIDQALNMTIRAEYYNASSVFTTNKDDNCTQYAWNEADSDLQLSVPNNSQDLSGLINNVTANGTLSGGTSLTTEGIAISAPLAEGGAIISLRPANGDQWSHYLSFDYDGNNGLCYPDKLPACANFDFPSATATFGQFRGNDRVIHWREVFK